MDGANLAICIKPALPTQVLDVFSMRGHIWQLSQESNGSRQVQKVLEEASDAGIEQLAVELTGHVLEAAQCPHANFVLQKFITPRAPIALRAITRELIAEGLKAIIQTARHRYGCRVLERILEHCEPAEANELSNLMLTDATSLCMHPYGNYAMQHLLLHGPPPHRQRLIDLVRANAAEMGANFHASAVLGQALMQASPQDAAELSLALLQTDGLIAQMSRTKHGLVAVRRAMQLVQAQAKREDGGKP